MKEKSTDIALYKNIYTYMKRKVDEYEGEVSEDLLRYRKEFNNLSKRQFDISSESDLFDQLIKSRITYIGDFHTFDQSSRNFQRILKFLNSQKKGLTLGLEVVHYTHQEIIDQYLDHHITDFEFLEMIDYKDSWRFPWHHYKIIFDLAKSRKIDIIGLNSNGSLWERDQKASSLIKDFLQENSDKNLLILFGEYHIIPSKIPFLVNSYMKNEFNFTIIHQNLDEVFWNLSKERPSFSESIVKFNKHEFSLQTSPPWIKYESMIYWYDNLGEDPDHGIHEYMIESGLMAFNSDVQDTFLFISHKLLEILSISISPEEVENFNLYDYQKISFINEKITEKLSGKSIITFLKSRLSKGRIFKIPFSSDFYCSSYSLNRISYLAGIHILDKFLKNINSDYEEKLLSGNKEVFLLFYTKFCTLGYFCSKIINPYRKCDLYFDLSHQILNVSLKPKYKKNIENSLKILDLENFSKLSHLLEEFDYSDLYSQARMIGHILGDTLYNRFYLKDSQEFQKIQNDLFAPEISTQNYQYLIRNILNHSYKKDKKRFF